MVDIHDDFDAWRKGQEIRSQSPKTIIIALKPDIKTLIEEGHSLKALWRYFTDRKKLSCSYEAFLRNVKKYIIQESLSGKNEQGKKSEVLKDFRNFNPKPDKEDLI